MTKNEIAYLKYQEATQAVLDGKEKLKWLRQEGEKAAERARKQKGLSIQDKLAAINTAWEPYKEQIANVEKEIENNYAIADENFDVWKGLK